MDDDIIRLILNYTREFRTTELLNHELTKIIKGRDGRPTNIDEPEPSKNIEIGEVNW